MSEEELYFKARDILDSARNTIVSGFAPRTNAYYELINLIKEHNINVLDTRFNNGKILLYAIYYSWIFGTELAKVMIDINPLAWKFIMNIKKDYSFRDEFIEDGFYEEFSYFVESDELGLL